MFEAENQVFQADLNFFFVLKIDQFWASIRNFFSSLKKCFVKKFLCFNGPDDSIIYYLNLRKTGIFSPIKRIEHNYRIQHTLIILGPKFHLEQTILSFWTRFAQKGYSQPKRKNLNITIEFSIFELF